MSSAKSVEGWNGTSIPLSLRRVEAQSAGLTEAPFFGPQEVNAIIEAMDNMIKILLVIIIIDCLFLRKDTQIIGITS